MTVYPLSHAKGWQDGSSDDLAAGCLHGILAGSAGEGHVDGAREGVARQAADGAAVLGIDGELHCSRLVDAVSLQGQRAGDAPMVDSASGGTMGIGVSFDVMPCHSSCILTREVFAVSC